MMMDTAKPVAAFAEVEAHFSFSAVMRIRLTHMGKASAKVSSISTPAKTFQPPNPKPNFTYY
jgi:hypothetical protein